MIVSVCRRACHNRGTGRSRGRLANWLSTSLREVVWRLKLGSVNAFHLTMRAADKWESARFLSLFLALGGFRFESDSTLPPLAANAGRWAGTGITTM